MTKQRASTVWVFKECQYPADGSRGAHWKDYFEEELEDFEWGGAEWIRSNQSKHFLQHEFQEGDLIVCYQRDDDEHGRAIIGFTRSLSEGIEDPPGSGAYTAFRIASTDDAFPLNRPIRIDELRQNGCSPKCFGRVARGTLYPIRASEFGGIVRVAELLNPDQGGDLRAWLKACRYRSPSGSPSSSNSQSHNQVQRRVSDVDKLLDKLERAWRDRSDAAVVRLVRRIVRCDQEIVTALKEKYRHRCQFPHCKMRIPRTNDSDYCEVAHLQSFSSGGESTRVNLVVVCPNHHKLIDYGDLFVKRASRRKLEFRLNGADYVINR
jgi:hypothetical protein